MKGKSNGNKKAGQLPVQASECGRTEGQHKEQKASANKQLSRTLKPAASPKHG